MNFIDIAVFVVLMLLISVIGVFFGRRNGSKNTHTELLVGFNLSTFSIALSVCSSFLSAISVLGFPSEIYFRGPSMLWFLAVYLISFPTVAYIFLPVFYNLKMSSLYEYLEKRFCLACRLIASITFIVQTNLYLAVALYAPALALSQTLNLSMIISIFITALISAIYLLMGGARAGIQTSALQMSLIIFSLFLVCIVSMIYWDINTLWRNAKQGLRLDVNDFRLHPQVRHSVWAFLIGATGNMLSLFGTNQLTIQRYMAMPTLKQAQRVVLMNIPLNSIMISMYTLLGLIVYAVYHGCHPMDLQTSDNILPYFVANKLNWITGLEGLFMASVYSAGISTLTACYNALTAVLIEDVIKVVISCMCENVVLNAKVHLRIIQLLPFCFALIAMILATLVGSLGTMILQIVFSIFGALGSSVLAVFIIGLFCPYITSKYSALAGQIAAITICLIISTGSLYYNVVPVDLPLSSKCLANSSSPQSFEYNPSFGTVSASSSGSLWVELSKISYQYYSVVAVLTCLIVSHSVQAALQLLGQASHKDTNPILLARFLRARPPNIIIEAAESQCLSKNYSEN